MSKSTVSTKPLTAADVRAFYADPRHGAKRLAALDPADRVSVAPRPADAAKPLRGRISKGAAAHFNKTTSRGVYVTGNTKEAIAEQTAAALALRVAAFEAGEAVGARGPLSNVARVAAGAQPIVRKGKGKSSRKGK